MSQAAKEVTAGWNLTAFILIRMGLHALYSWRSNGQSEEEFFKGAIKKKIQQKFQKKKKNQKNSKVKVK